MPWYAVIEDATGRLVSVGTRVAEALPTGLVAIEVTKPDFAMVQWDTATRAFMARPEPPPLVDRLQDLLTHDTYQELRTLFGAMNAAQKDVLRRAFVTLLGPYRYRRADEREYLD